MIKIIFSDIIGEKGGYDMLINFTVAGFASINQPQELTFSAFKGQKILSTKYEQNYILSSVNRPTKSSVIFGNNAVGKTNILYALLGLQQMISTGLPIKNERVFNRLSDTISFEIIVESDEGNSFEYTIKVNKNEQIIVEKLIKNQDIIFKFSNNRLYSELLDDKIQEIYSRESTSTLLSKLKDFITDIYNEFVATINNISVVTDMFLNSDVKWFNITFSNKHKELIQNNKELAIQILRQVDPTIKDIEFEERISDDSDTLNYDVKIVRFDEYKQPIRFLLAFESKGIKRIVFLLINLLEVHLGKTILVDELDASISTKSLILLFNEIINSSKNKKGQLIVTSHNLELFDLSLFAPQQIYIVSKDHSLSTVVNSLADFQLRTNKKRLALEFLKGSFEVI